jgi:hypothetical protein
MISLRTTHTFLNFNIFKISFLYNSTIFAYGQTGSGKTYTMLGKESGIGASASLEPENRGLLPRVMDHLFTCIARQTRKGGGKVEYLTRASFLEIYNEKIYDLMDPACHENGLQLRETLDKGVYVDGLSEKVVSSAAEAHSLMISGAQQRTVGATAMNRESSRSHSVFTLIVQSKVRIHTWCNNCYI